MMERRPKKRFPVVKRLGKSGITLSLLDFFFLASPKLPAVTGAFMLLHL
jgi:hypothetical protein